MSKLISLFALPLAGLAFLPGGAAAQTSSPLLLAQGTPPPQQQQGEAPPGQKEGEAKGKKDGKHGRGGQPPHKPGAAGAKGGAAGGPKTGPQQKQVPKQPPLQKQTPKLAPQQKQKPKLPPQQKQLPKLAPQHKQLPKQPPQQKQLPKLAPQEKQAPKQQPKLRGQGGQPGAGPHGGPPLHRDQGLPRPLKPQSPPGELPRAKIPGIGQPPPQAKQPQPGAGAPPTAKQQPGALHKQKQKQQHGPANGGPPLHNGKRQPGPQGGQQQGAQPRRQQKPPQAMQPPLIPHRGGPGGFAGGNMDNIKKQRRQRTEDGGKRTVIEEPGNRVIVKEGGEARIRHDETERLRRTSHDVRRERGKDGSNITIAVRPGGIEVYSEFDNDGRLLRRYRRGRDGRDTMLIDNRRSRGERDHRDHNGFGFFVDLGAPRIGLAHDRYIVDYERASEDDLYEALTAPPVEALDRDYSLDEVRYNRSLRDRMRRVDLDTVNFDLGSWEVAPSQYDKLELVARVMNRILNRRPDEIFLIEGHTDAVGSDVDNLTLSDRRAEEVAYILTEHFGVPPENLVTQGYGEEYLKIDSPGPERVNRRVAVRRITPLMSRR